MLLLGKNGLHIKLPHKSAETETLAGFERLSSEASVGWQQQHHLCVHAKFSQPPFCPPVPKVQRQSKWKCKSSREMNYSTLKRTEKYRDLTSSSLAIISISAALI